MSIRVIKDSIKLDELKSIAEKQFGNLIKAVVDVEQEIMAVGGELHSDEEVILMEQENSKRENTWGINLYLEKSDDDWIEFDSMINLKPSFGNRFRRVENPIIQEKIRKIIKKLVVK
jgi:hypothetical protein